MTVSRSQALLAAILAAAIGAMIVRFGAGIALLTPALVGVMALVLLVRFMTHADDEAFRQRLLRWTLASFALHLLAGLLLTTVGGPLRHYFAAPDAATYNYNAILIVRHWTHGFPAPNVPAGKEGYYYILAALYWLFGAHAVAGLALNAAFGAALVPLLADTTKSLFDSEAARYAIPLAVLVPGLFLWTAQLLKEAPIFFFIALAVNGAVRMSRAIGFGSLLGVAVSLAALFTLRSWVGLVIAAALVAALTLARGQFLSGLGTSLGIFSAVAILLALGLGYSGYNAAVGSDLQQANATRQGLALNASTGFDPNVNVSNTRGAVSYLPRGLAELALGPFPWQVHSLQQLPVIPDMLVWWYFLPSLWRGVRTGWGRTNRRILILLLPAASTAILLALSVGNYGTLVRERAQIVVLLVPIIAFGLTVRSSRRAGVDPVPEALVDA